MSDRERWTVYPLLLLSLAISLRDKLSPPSSMHVRELVCRQIDVIDDDGKPRAALGASTDNAGLIELMAADGKPRVLLAAGNAKSNQPVLQLLGDDGKSRAVITASVDDAGLVELMAADGKPRLLIAAGNDQSNQPVVQLLGDDGMPHVTLNNTQQGSGRLEIARQGDHPVVVVGAEQTAQAGTITTFADKEHPQVLITSVQGNGTLTTVGPEQKKLVELSADTSSAGVVTTYSGDNARAVVLDAASGFGRVTTFDPQRRAVFSITHDDQGAGFALTSDAQGKLYLVFTVPIKLTPAGEVQKPAATEPPLPQRSQPEPQAPASEDENSPDAPTGTPP